MKATRYPVSHYKYPLPSLPQFPLNEGASPTRMAPLLLAPSRLSLPGLASPRTPQTRKKREGFYSQASKDLQTRAFYFKKEQGNTGGLRRGSWAGGLGQATPGPCPPDCPLVQRDGW